MPSIVVVGGGFAGIETALKLKKKIKEEADITLISDREFFTFTPGLGKLLRDKDKKDITMDLASFLSRKGIKFIKGAVTNIDLNRKKVVFRTGREKFDFLVLALGTVSDTHGVKGVADHAMEYARIEDIDKIRKHIDTVLKLPSTLKKVEKDRALTIAVVGGGPKGVGLAGEMNEFLDRCCENHGIRRIDVKLVLVEALPEPLSLFPVKARNFASNHLRRQGVEISTSSTVMAVKKDSLLLKGGSSIDTNTVIWCGGTRPNTLMKKLGLKTDENGGVLVNPYMQTSEATIYALGDCSVRKDMKYRRPDTTTIPNAQRQAEIVAHNISTNILGGKKKDFKDKTNTLIISMGRKMTLLVKGSFVMKGWPATLLKSWNQKFYMSRP